MVCDGGRQLPPAMETTRHPTSARPLLKTKGDTWGGKQSEMTLCYQVSSFACSACFCFLSVCLSVFVCVCFLQFKKKLRFFSVFFFFAAVEVVSADTHIHTYARLKKKKMCPRSMKNWSSVANYKKERGDVSSTSRKKKHKEDEENGKEKREL